MKRFTLLLALLLLLPAVSTAAIDLERTVIRLGEPDSVSVERHYTAVSGSTISYLIPERYSPSDVDVVDPGEGVECEVEQLDIGQEVVCSPPPGENYTLKIQFEGAFTDAAEGYREFSYSNQVFANTERVETKVVLPEGYGVLDTEEAYSPANADPGGEGRNIFLAWTHEDVSVGQTLSYEVQYERLGAFESIQLQRLTVVLALAVLVLAGAVVYVRRREGEKTIASVFPMLKDDEQEVVQFLVDRDGEAEQRDIVDSLDYSKAKVSRLLSDLEERSIVEKEKRGRVNVVALAREIGELEG